MALSDELQQARVRDQIARWDANEKRLAEQLGLDVPKTILSTDTVARLDFFAKWAAAKGVRKCPCKPHVLAAFAWENHSLGVPQQQTLAILKAVEEQHHHFNLSNPAATKIVWAAVETICKAEPPRSWTKAEKAEWVLLPPDIRQAISRREAERDKALRRSQNELADLKKRHAVADEAASSKQESTEQ